MQYLYLYFSSKGIAFDIDGLKTCKCAYLPGLEICSLLVLHCLVSCDYHVTSKQPILSCDVSFVYGRRSLMAAILMRSNVAMF